MPNVCCLLLVGLLFWLNLVYAIFLNRGFLCINKCKGHTLHSGQLAERGKKSSSKMFPRPRIEIRVQIQHDIWTDSNSAW